MMARELFPDAPDARARRQVATTLAMVSPAGLATLEQIYAGVDDRALFRRQQRAFRRWMLRRAGWRARLSTQRSQRRTGGNTAR